MVFVLVLVCQVIFSQASLLVEQLHHVLKQNKLDQPGTLIRLQYADAEVAGPDPDRRWFFMGSLQKMRPQILHTLVHLTPRSDANAEADLRWVLRLDIVDSELEGQRMARISTSHQVLRSMYTQRAHHSQDIAVCVWSSIAAESSDDFGNGFLAQSEPSLTATLGPSFKAEIQQKQTAKPARAAARVQISEIVNSQLSQLIF